METKIKKTCPNCSQLYHIKSLSQVEGNIPLFLSCGHSMCESCVISIIKSVDPIECKVCQKDTTISAADREMLQQNKIKLYKLFPINCLLCGELFGQMIEQSTKGPKKPEDNFYIDLNAIIKSTDNTQAECLECHQITNQMCPQCNINMCSSCFTKTHKNFLMFKNHVLINIEATPQSNNNCKIHKSKPLEYYCKDCSKSICMDCLVVGGDKYCKNHTVVSLQEVNDGFFEDLNSIAPQVNETYRRLTKTAVDVGNLLNNIENDTGSSSELTQMLALVEHNVSKLMSNVQRHKTEVTDTILKLKCSEKESLLNVRADLIVAIKKAKMVINNINAISNLEKAKKANLSVILDEAKQVVDTPWYLAKEETNDPLKMTVKEDVCSLVSYYLHLEDNAGCVYKMHSTTELGPHVEIPPAPRAPVFPPELPIDVRYKHSAQQPRQPMPLITSPPKFISKSVAQQPRQPMPLITSPPKFISKSVSGSVSSLNSFGSDNSNNSSSTVYGDCYQKPTVQQVQPFAESRALKPKPLVEGSQELIYITHIVDPHHFYVQRSCHQNVAKELIKEFRNASSMPKPSENHIAEGKMYLVLNKADTTWQRCRVVSIDRKKPTNPTLQVFCVDFGSTETVTVDKLRLLPAVRLQEPCPLAIRCMLANCQPRFGTWTSEDAFLIQEIIDNKPAGIHVHAVHSDAGLLVTLEVDVMTLEGGVNLARALAFHERARLLSRHRHTMSNMVSITEKPKIFINNSDFKPRSEDQVYLTLVVSPDKFFVRKKHLQPVFEKLCEDLDQEYTELGNTGKIYLPEVGMSCVVNTEKLRGDLAGGAWARAIVNELPGGGRVRLFLPDCGIMSLVHWSRLRSIQMKFTMQRALATECHLAGVSPLNKKWHPESVELLLQYQERVLSLHVDNTCRGSVGVTLYDHSDEDNVVCINTEMIKYKFAITFGIFNFHKTPVVEEQVFTNQSPPECTQSQRPRPKTKPEVTVLSRSKPLKISDSELEAKDKGPLRLEARVLHYQSPSLVYVSLIHQQMAFNELYSKIQKFYGTTKNIGKSESWVVGDRCCTLCTESETWRRAVVTEILPGNKAKVFYSDFALVETVPMESLRELTAEFATIGDAAIKCHLCGITTADGREEWPSITKEYLKELLDAYHRVFITKVGNFKNKSMPVELWVYHTIQGGALEPNISEWRCLNRRIVDQGLAVPDKTQQIPNKETKNNVTSSVDDWLQLEPLPTKPLPIKPDPSPSTSPTGDTDNDTLDKAEASGSSTVFISDWLPPKPLAEKEFKAMPTYVDNDAVIYLHSLTQRGTLELIHNALDVRFKAPDPKAKYQRWTVGEPCIAKLSLDNRFYRGRVMEINYDDSNCLIHYVDYGNEELCSFENMRKSIALYQIPVQAHRCALAKIRPVGDKWARNALDYINKSIVEKECLVKVIGEPVNGIIPINIKFDQLWMNDHLVDFDMAVYNDGSRPLVPQFAAVPAEPGDEPIVIESDSDPDNIVADSSYDSLDYESMKNQDWNDLLAEDEAPKGKMILFPVSELQEFLCNVTFINGTEEFELTVCHDRETDVLYKDMQTKLQTQCKTMPPLDGIFLNKACVALYCEDNMWYRAAILQYGEAEKKVKVCYVDYGNKAVVSLADVREISPDFTMLPPATIAARLHAIKVNPKVDLATLTNEYESIFLEGKGPLHAKVIEYDKSTPYVELRNDDGELAYGHLITKGIFIKCEPQQ